MQFYLITNTAMLKKYEWAQKFKYHLVLAQVLKQDPEYFALVQGMIQNGVNVILDNGVHEGVICSLSEYYEIANKLQPECVVLPDLIGAHAIESRTRSLTFYQWLLRERWPIPSIMYVPQGLCQREVVDEFLWSIEYFRDKPHVTRIGIGDAYKHCYTINEKDLAVPPETIKVRLVKNMIDECTKCSLITTPPEMHVLGGRATPSKFYSQQPNIVGIDSVDPCRCALADQLYPIQNTEYERSIRPAFDFADQQVSSFTMLYNNMKRFCEAYGAKFE